VVSWHGKGRPRDWKFQPKRKHVTSCIAYGGRCGMHSLEYLATCDKAAYGSSDREEVRLICRLMKSVSMQPAIRR